jgi:hypothetical protein
MLAAEYLPDGMSCAKEAKELMADFAKGLRSIIGTFPPCQTLARTEFIVMVSSEAHDICEKGSKKTIAPEHIVQALKVCLRLSSFPKTDAWNRL